MINNIYNFLYRVFSFVGAGWIFISACALVFFSFVLVLVLSLVKSEYALKKRAWFFVGSCAVCFIELSALVTLGESLALFYLTVGFSLALSLPVILVNERSSVDKKQSRELARYIDQQVKNTVEEEPFIKSLKAEKQVDECLDCLSNNEQAKNFEIDFQHVKNVISRMEFFGLNSNDKKTVKELENAIIQAENGKFDLEIKEQINEGLGALLKIMSKYGV
jgi:hypothetical protein